MVDSSSQSAITGENQITITICKGIAAFRIAVTIIVASNPVKLDLLSVANIEATVNNFRTRTCDGRNNCIGLGIHHIDSSAFPVVSVSVGQFVVDLALVSVVTLFGREGSQSTPFAHKVGTAHSLHLPLVSGVGGQLCEGKGAVALGGCFCPIIITLSVVFEVPSSLFATGNPSYLSRISSNRSGIESGRNGADSRFNNHVINIPALFNIGTTCTCYDFESHYGTSGSCSHGDYHLLPVSDYGSIKCLDSHKRVCIRSICHITHI